jgi:hypothetical protein
MKERMDQNVPKNTGKKGKKCSRMPVKLLDDQVRVRLLDDNARVRLLDDQVRVRC